MNQKERRIFLIKKLLCEQPEYARMKIPQEEQEQKNLFRSLCNIRKPAPAGREFLEIQDAYLQEETRQKGITDFSGLLPIQEGIYLWQGDITTLCCDAIVNAANSGMTGCYHPLHSCIDNQIHSFAGIQLRLACAGLMEKQGHEEETGQAKITPAFNLPCKYILHTVGPIIYGKVTDTETELLSSCYRSCLALADGHGIKSLAFCCISTGEFHFPNSSAARVAVRTVKEYKRQTHSRIEVIFNVFKESDYEIYHRLLGADNKSEK